LRRARVHYGERFEVTMWTPRKEWREAAQERVEGMVGYFLNCTDRRSLMQWQNDLYTLARSCYLQGAQDAAMVAAKMRLEEAKKADELT
jgi:hypothetical protein